MEHIFLRPLEDQDIVQMKQWLEQERIKRWYEHPEEWLREISLRHSTFSFLRHKIAMLGERPVGFCQYYDCFSAGEDWYTMAEPGKIYSIDYLIGEADCLKKGFGREIVNALTGEIRQAAPEAELVVVQPDADNAPSVRTLLSAGYKYDEERKYYYKRLK